jgi:ABC-type phosphate transport system permease subunit
VSKRAPGVRNRAPPAALAPIPRALIKTTEFAVFVAVFVGILLALFLVKTVQDHQRPDYVRADKAA